MPTTPSALDGIRVIGPLFPVFTDHQAKLVLLDGQGLGHTPDSSTSVTTHITRRFSEVDAILLVDNAEQPVQAARSTVELVGWRVATFTRMVESQPAAF